MAVWFVLDIPGVTREQADAILRNLGLSDRPAPGQLFHVEGPGAAGGIRVADVWESEEVFGRFFHERLAPAFQQAGVQVPENLQPEFMPVYNILR
jgi:hypothetical protein